MIYAPSLRDHVQLGKSLEITNALIAVHVTSQTLYTEITNAVFSIPLSPFSLDLSTAMKYASFKKQSTETHPPQQTFLL